MKQQSLKADSQTQTTDQWFSVLSPLWWENSASLCGSYIGSITEWLGFQCGNLSSCRCVKRTTAPSMDLFCFRHDKRSRERSLSNTSKSCTAIQIPKHSTAVYYNMCRSYSTLPVVVTYFIYRFFIEMRGLRFFSQDWSHAKHEQTPLKDENW